LLTVHHRRLYARARSEDDSTISELEVTVNLSDVRGGEPERAPLA
jgi:hypothetical protein